MKPIWYPSADLVAQIAHFLAGALAVIGTTKLLKKPAWQGAAGITVFAAVKEFLFDALIERQGFFDNATDFGFYLLGALAAMIAQAALLKRKK